MLISIYYVQLNHTWEAKKKYIGGEGDLHGEGPSDTGLFQTSQFIESQRISLSSPRNLLVLKLPCPLFELNYRFFTQIKVFKNCTVASEVEFNAVKSIGKLASRVYSPAF